MKYEDAFLNDSHISKIHQLNRISDLKCLSCELGCMTYFSGVFSEPGRFKQFYLNAHLTLFIDFCSIVIFLSTMQVYRVHVAWWMYLPKIVGKMYSVYLKLESSKYEQTPQTDPNSWSAVHNPHTLTTELWWYLTKSIYTINWTKH